jgi:hypothetical protein
MTSMNAGSGEDGDIERIRDAVDRRGAVSSEDLDLKALRRRARDG